MSEQLQLLLILAIIITASKLAGHISRRYLHQPVVFGEILVGLLLGPTALNLYGWPIFAQSYRMLQTTVDAFAYIGVLLLLFIAGLETDLAQMRSVGKPAVATAVSGVIVPIGCGMLTGLFFGMSPLSSLFIGVVLSATSVSITAQTLLEIKRFRCKEGATIMGAAVADDVLGIIVMSFVIAFGAAETIRHPGSLSLPALAAARLQEWSGIHAATVFEVFEVVIVLLCIGAFALIAWAVYWWVPRILSMSERIHASHAVPAAALVFLLLSAFGAQYIGQVAAITGAYLAGVCLASSKYRKQVEEAIHPFTYAFFVPIFFTSIGLQANAKTVSGDWRFILVIILVAILTKIIGCGFGAWMSGFTRKESLRVGIGMISRGEVGLIVAQVGFASALLSRGQYAGMIIMVLATTVATPVLLRLVFPPGEEVSCDVYESVVALEEEDDQIIG